MKDDEIQARGSIKMAERIEQFMFLDEDELTSDS